MPATRSMFRDLALMSGLVTPEQLDQAFLTAGVAEGGRAESEQRPGRQLVGLCEQEADLPHLFIRK